MILINSYPKLYNNSNTKQATLEEVEHWNENKWEWNMSWRRQ